MGKMKNNNAGDEEGSREKRGGEISIIPNNMLAGCAL